MLLGRRTRQPQPVREPAGTLDNPVAGVRIWVAYKRWRRAPLLMSVAIAGWAWKAATESASCRGWRSHHDAPTEDCECGLYAYWYVDDNVLQMLCTPWDLPNGMRGSGVVLGAVIGWGDRVVLHPEGWRAQNARVVALAEPDGAATLALVERRRAGRAPLQADHLSTPGLNSAWAQPSLLDELAVHYAVPIVPVRLLEACATEHGTRPDLMETFAGS